MTARDDLDRRLAAWFEADAAPREPEHLLGQVLARTARTRRRPAWRVPERWIPMSTITTRTAEVPRVPWRLVGVAALLVLGLVIGAVLVAGGRFSGPSLSDSITGHWKLDPVYYIDFGDDGSYLVSVSREGTGRLEWGTWSVEGSTLTQTPASDSRYCAGFVGTYEIRVVDEGNRLESTVQGDACPQRLAGFGSGLTRLPDAEP